MTENPYRLARDIRGIGFKTADAIAMKLGIEKTAMVRVRAGISYALTEAMDEGNCGLSTEELITLAEKLLEVHRSLFALRLNSNCRRVRWSPTVSAKRPVYFWPVCIVRSAASPSG
jgi:exodeoxyribonuclease V alpha subunit